MGVIETSVAHVCYILFTQALEEKYESKEEVLKETKQKLDVAMSNNEHASSLLQVIIYVLYHRITIYAFINLKTLTDSLKLAYIKKRK